MSKFNNSFSHYCINELKPPNHHITTIRNALHLHNKKQYYEMISKHLPNTLRNGHTNPIPDNVSNFIMKIQTHNNDNNDDDSSCRAKKETLNDSLIRFQEMYHHCINVNRRKKKKHLELNKENKSFSNEYHVLEERKNHNQTKAFMNYNAIFHIANKYADNNISVPDISIKKSNIFTKSPLVVGLKNLKDYFLFNNNTESNCANNYNSNMLNKQYKTISYLRKIQKELNSKIHTVIQSNNNSGDGNGSNVHNTTSTTSMYQYNSNKHPSLKTQIAIYKKEITALKHACDDVDDFQSFFNNNNNNTRSKPKSMSPKYKYKHKAKSQLILKKTFHPTKNGNNTSNSVNNVNAVAFMKQQQKRFNTTHKSTCNNSSHITIDNNNNNNNDSFSRTSCLYTRHLTNLLHSTSSSSFNNNNNSGTTVEQLYHKSLNNNPLHRSQSERCLSNIRKYLNNINKDNKYNLSKDVSSKSTYIQFKKNKDVFIKNYIKEEYHIRTNKGKLCLKDNEVQLINKSDTLHNELLECEQTLRKMVYEGKLYSTKKYNIN